MATSPNAANRLRELVLSLAIQGKLVPQEAKDSSAGVLLTQIRLEIIGHTDPVDDGFLNGGPFALPKTWEWVPLGEVVEVIRGITFPASEKTRETAPNRVACLRTTNIQQSVEWEDLLFVDRSFVGREDQLIRHHDIVMSMANSRELVGKVALIEHVPYPQATFGGFLGVVRPRHIEPRYVMAVLRSRYARTALVVSASQTTNIANISLGKLRPLPFPLPPLAEQHRIVARVEELMKLCDALERSGRLADEQHAWLTSTLFDALAASESAHALAENWQRIAEHIDLLLDRPEAIDAVEQTILRLAVRGLLAGESDPSGWADATLGSVVEFLNGYAFKSDWFRSEGVRLVRNVNVGHGKLSWSNGAWVDDAVARDLERFALAAGDLVISLDRPIISSGLKYAVVRECDLPCLLLQRVARMTPRAMVLDPAYLELWLRSPVFIGSIDPGRSNGVPHISTRQLEAIPFLLPLLAEQHRIVARVEELRALCAQLRERLTDARRTQSQLADALVARAVG